MTKERFCWNCGKSMGFVEDRHYDSRDTCGQLECERAGQDVYRQEREEAHRDLDDRMGW